MKINSEILLSEINNGEHEWIIATHMTESQKNYGKEKKEAFCRKIHKYDAI